MEKINANQAANMLGEKSINQDKLSNQELNQLDYFFDNASDEDLSVLFDKLVGVFIYKYNENEERKNNFANLVATRLDDTDASSLPQLLVDLNKTYQESFKSTFKDSKKYKIAPEYFIADSVNALYPRFLTEMKKLKSRNVELLF